MSAPVDLGGLVAAADAVGEDEDDTRLLAESLELARQYVASFPWCERVLRQWLGNGVGGVFAVSLVEIEPARQDVDRWLWIINGDLPPLYLTAADVPTARE